MKISELTITEKKKLYKRACDAYYAGEPIMTDSQFDKLEALIRKQSPNWAYLSATHTNTIGKKEKVELPHYMPSLGKVYPKDLNAAAIKRLNANSIVVSDKLDGSSVMAVYEDGKPVKLITRGDGTVGKDISFLIPYVNIPQSFKYKSNMVLRMEAIMRNSVFAKTYAKKKDTKGNIKYANPRNLVAGILNRKLDAKTDKQELADIDFVVLGVYGECYATGQAQAHKLGFKTVNQQSVATNKVTAEKLSKMLAARRTKSDYAMDGLVLIGAEQVFDYADADKPKWSFAFKENVTEENAPQAKVKRIIWQQSHALRLIPKVEIEPIEMDGVTVKYATVHNAKWMLDRKIGPGAVIKIVRSGDVIPKIVGVVKPGKTQLPEVDYYTKGVHFIAVQHTETSQARSIERFLTVCGIEGWKRTSIEKHLDNLGSIDDYIWYADQREDTAIEEFISYGIGKVSARKLIRELQKLHGISIIKLLVGSGVFDAGVGERRLEDLAQHITPKDWFRLKSEELRAKIESLHGYGEALAEEIARGIRAYKKTCKQWESWIEISYTVKKPAKAKVTSSKYEGVKATWTGYRNKEEEAEILAGGGEIVGFGSKTTHLFYKEGGKQSSKIAKAGDRAMTWGQFKKLNKK